MEGRRLSDCVVTFKRRRRSGEDLYSTATQLVSIAPTQDCDVAAAVAPLAQPRFEHAPAPSFLPPRPRAPAQPRASQQAWGLSHEAAFWRDLDQEELLETDVMSRQTTPGASRAASPGLGPGPSQPGPCTAPQLEGADLAAVISQRLGQEVPGSEEIRRHYPRVREQYEAYRACMAEQQLSPLRLREFYRHSQPKDWGPPML